MSSKKEQHDTLFTRLNWWITERAIQAATASFGILPLRWIPRVAAVFGSMGYHLIRGRRKIALSNLEKVWGSTTTGAQRQALVKALFKNITCDFLEGLRSYRSPEQIGDMDITVVGREHLDRAIEKGKGVAAVSAHMGNFSILVAKLSDLGYPIGLIFKTPKNRAMAEMFVDSVNRHGVQVIRHKPRQVSVLKSIKLLKKNGVVFFLIDQNPRKRFGSYVEFFGYEIPMYAGPVVMAMRSGAALLPMYMHRNDDNSQVITILPEIELAEASDRNTAVTKTLRKINELFEEWITAYPSQWWWIHRRFRRARSLQTDEKPKA